MIRRRAIPHVDKQRPRRKTRERKAMTICISALADEAIVCIADKMLSFGDYSEWDSDVTKILRIGKTHVLFAGGLSESQSVIEALYLAIEHVPYYPGLAEALQTVYKTQYSISQDTNILHTAGISRERYEQAISSPSVSEPIFELFKEMREYDFECDIMICGFDDARAAYILSVSPPGKLYYWWIQGFNSIGSGCNVSNSRLLWSGYKRTHSVGRVLFDVFDAKAIAELSPGVGRTWDAKIIYRDGEVYTVPKNVKDLIERSWESHNKSPFEAWNSEEFLPKPPRGWKEKILSLGKSDFVRDII